MGKKAKCYADGGIIGADGLTDRQRAALGATRNSLGVNNTPPTPQQAQAPVHAPAPAPVPQQQGITSGIVGLLKGRQQQIDKAAGYARGGIVRGKGGVDNVPMAIGGIDVNLTGGKKPEAVLPGKTVEALGGPAAVEALIEETNGKPPVKDGLKEGGNYADGLVINEEDPRLKPFGPTAPDLGSGIYGMSKTVASAGVPAPATITNGRNATGTITADSAQSMAAAPMQRSGGIAGSIDMAGVNGILARENKARGEMIDLSIKANGGNGIGILGDEGAQDRENAEKTARWRRDDLVSLASRGNQGAVIAAINADQQASQEPGRREIALRGQDLNHSAAIAGQGITMRGQDITARGQDISAANEAVRAGVDRERLGIAQADSRRADQKFWIEKGILEGNAADQKAVRDARTALTAAMASGDPKAIEAAKANATAAGIKFDKPQLEFVTTTDSIGMNVTRTNKDTGAIDIIDGKSGKVKASIPGAGAQSPAQAPIPQGYSVVGTSGGKRVLQDAQGKRFVEGN